MQQLDKKTLQTCSCPGHKFREPVGPWARGPVSPWAREPVARRPVSPWAREPVGPWMGPWVGPRARATLVDASRLKKMQMFRVYFIWGDGIVLHRVDFCKFGLAKHDSTIQTIFWGGKVHPEKNGWDFCPSLQADVFPSTSWYHGTRRTQPRAGRAISKLLLQLAEIASCTCFCAFCWVPSPSLTYSSNHQNHPKKNRDSWAPVPNVSWDGNQTRL